MYRPISRLTGGALAATGAILAIAAVASVILLSSPGPAAGMPAAHARPQQPNAVPASTTISLRTTNLGKILVAPDGNTLYAFSRDARNQDRCAVVSGCTGVWPIVAADGTLKAGHGVNASLLRTITVRGVKQVTYAGHPLYTYVADSGPADTAYVGVSQFGGAWPAVSATGRVVK
jgi:predicted lipoprotein with Yx(FWY)xxD motif